MKTPQKLKKRKKRAKTLVIPVETPEIAVSDVEVPDYSEHQILGALCRASFAEFVKEFWSIIVPEKLIWSWHMQLLCDEFQKVAERVFANLPKAYDEVVNISPGTSKSTIASIMLPAWAWTRMPSCRIISGSYQYSLATDLSRKSRDVIKSELYQKCFPGIDIREDQDSKGFFVNTKGGERYAIGTDGGVMGKHAHIIIIDDPLDPKQAASDADLKTANRWMEETLPSRKVDKRVTPTILIMQRLHEYDPSGSRLAKADKVPVRHICLPAELTDKVNPPELAAFYVDGLMDPVRLDRQVLAEAESQGDYSYAGQYLQDPIPRGGAMFDVTMLKIGTPPPHFRWIVRYWDKAGTCLIAGTSVKTMRGDVPIEEVVEGDIVLTRSGYKRVVWSREMKKTRELTTATFTNGAKITGTSDHRVWTENRGWVALADLNSARYDNSALTGDKSWQLGIMTFRQSNSMASTTSRKRNTTSGILGTSCKNDTSRTLCIVPSTDFIMALSQPDMMFTTSTEIPRTTLPTTSESSHARLTVNCTMLSKNGMLPTRPKSRGRRTGKKLSKCSPLVPSRSTPAYSVEKLSNRDIKILSGFATVENRVAIKRLTSEARPDVVLTPDGFTEVDRVVTSTSTFPVAVFDISVEDCPEFFANGILVHNSGGGAFTVGALVAADKTGHFWVLDIVRGQWNSGQREKIIRSTAEKDKRSVTIILEQEPGPIWEEELVQMADGALKKLRNVRIGDRVIGQSGSAASVTGVHVRGELDSLRIETDSGRVIHADASHPFFTPTGWTKAGDLKVGICLGLPGMYQLESDANGRTGEEARLAGYFVGDGCCTFAIRDGARTNTVNSLVTCSDPIQGKDIIHCAESVGAVCKVGGVRKWSYRMSKGIRDWLKDAGMAGKSTATKTVPEWIMRGPVELAANFIGAFFACDGCVSFHKGSSSIELYNTNKPLLQQIQTLLLRFGIYSRLRVRVYSREFQKTRHTQYRLTIPKSSDAQALFAQHMVVFGKKREGLNRIPRNDFQRRTLPDAIVSIESGGKLPCRCLTVAEEDSFLVNDIIVHNSGGKESAEGSVRNLAGFKVILHKVGKADGDKIDRADAFSAQVNIGNVSLAKAEWNDILIHEFRFFPKSRYKDIVDSCSGGFNRVAQRKLTIGGRTVLRETVS